MGLIFLLPFYIWENLTVPAAIFDATAIVSILYLGVFASFIAFILWHKAILVAGASKAGMIYYTLPLFSGILAWLLLGEAVGTVHLISGALIISGIFLANHEKRAD